MLRIVGERGTVTVNEAKDARECNKNKKREMENRWYEKMYEQYVRDMTEVDWERTWQWLRKNNLVNVWEGLTRTGRSEVQTYPRESGRKWGFQSSVGLKKQTNKPQSVLNKSFLRGLNEFFAKLCQDDSYTKPSFQD